MLKHPLGSKKFRNGKNRKTETRREKMEKSDRTKRSKSRLHLKEQDTDEVDKKKEESKSLNEN